MTITMLRSNSEKAAIRDLASQVNPEAFFKTFGATLDHLEMLIQSNTVTIHKVKMSSFFSQFSATSTSSYWNSRPYAISLQLYNVHCRGRITHRVFEHYGHSTCEPKILFAIFRARCYCRGLCMN